jgi:hypothetical protein
MSIEPLVFVKTGKEFIAGFITVNEAEQALRNEGWTALAAKDQVERWSRSIKA